MIPIQWRAPRGMGTTALMLSWLIWIWILVFRCVGHYRALRYLVSALCLLILVVFQSVTFAVVNSNVCDDADCEMGRGACNAIVLKSANLKLLAHFDALV
jgi:hypothetical protein